MGILFVEYGEIKRCGNDVSIGVGGAYDYGYDWILGELKEFWNKLVINW